MQKADRKKQSSKKCFMQNTEKHKKVKLRSINKM